MVRFTANRGETQLSDTSPTKPGSEYFPPGGKGNGVHKEKTGMGVPQSSGHITADFYMVDDQPQARIVLFIP